MGELASSEAVRLKIRAAHAKLQQTTATSIQVRLPLPYAPVIVHRNGEVTTAETHMRVYSLTVQEES